MTVTIQPGPVSGALAAIPSKSAAHRLLICAALGDRPAFVVCDKESQDIAATIRCLTGLGAEIHREGRAAPPSAFFCPWSALWGRPGPSTWPAGWPTGPWSPWPPS